LDVELDGRVLVACVLPEDAVLVGVSFLAHLLYGAVCILVEGDLLPACAGDPCA
jgi:hypothetical protein